MNKYLFLGILTLLLICSHLWAQDKRGYTVIYGGSADYAKFSGDTSKPITGHYFPFVLIRIFMGGSSNICDSANGNLIFMCPGYVLYDTLGNIIENGDSLVPSKIYSQNADPVAPITQGSLILPKGSNNQYYIFTPTITDTMYNYLITNPFGDGRFPYNLLQYHIVDMNANGGMGKVIQKNVKILENTEICKTGMMACKHANGYDWWLLKQGANANTIYAFLVTKDTVVLDTIQTFPEPVFGYYDLTGQSCFNSDGSKYAFATGGGYLNNQGAHLFVADFDRCYGIMSNVKEIKVPYDSTLTILDSLWQAYDSLITGVCFSPNDSFLYVNRRYNIYQYDLNESDSLIAWFLLKQGPDTLMLEKGQLQLGVDGRVYVGKRNGGGNSNSVINKPNIKGVGCNYCPLCLRCDTCDYTHSFANMPNFNMPKKEPCWPLSSEQVTVNSNELEVYPNPSSTVFIIQNKQGKKKELYNVLGELLFSTRDDEINVRHFARGVYYIRCEGESKKVVIE